MIKKYFCPPKIMKNGAKMLNIQMKVLELGISNGN